MIFPGEKEFLNLSKKGNLIPVYKEILGDLDTPVSAYYKIAKKEKYSFLLESVEGEEKVARYSFMAKSPEIVFKCKGDRVEITRLKHGRKYSKIHTVQDNPLSFIQKTLKQFHFVPIDGLPPFCGGVVGYIGYDTVRFFERLPNKPTDDLRLPDMILMLAKEIIIFDHINHKMKIVSNVEIGKNASLPYKRNVYRKAISKINALSQEIQKSLSAAVRTRRPMALKSKLDSNYTQPQFESIVREAKKKIKAGEIIQAVLSQRFKIDLKTDPFHIYRMLRALNPSPYMYYLNFGQIKIIGSSPELLVRCENRIVETRPIAGTRPRGKNEKNDQRLAQDLLNDPKEKAEHIMLVDLGRNDLGRVCSKGSVIVSEFMLIERYSHVMHIVSNVKGRLKRGKNAFDVLQAAFPAGTLSGAPKIRAMEIIDELENVSRGPYGGCIGYFSFSGNLDTCITIRTIIVSGKKAYVQAGAGIVADSHPQKEYQETINKAKAQILAIKKAHEIVHMQY